MQINEPSTHVMDATAIGLALAALAGYMPSIAATLSVIWMAIRIYETETVRGWIRREQREHERQLLAAQARAVKAKEDVIEQAKEIVKPEVVKEVIAALPLVPEIAKVIEEKVLTNDTNKPMAPPEGR